MEILEVNPVWHYFLKKQPWWDKYKRNTIKYRCRADIPIERKIGFSILLGGRKRNSVISAFLWDHSPEGHEYWKDVNASLPIYLPGEDKKH